MIAPKTPEIEEIRRLLHQLRESFGALALQLGILEDDGSDARTSVTGMRAAMGRASAVFADIDFVIENGHAPALLAERPRSKHRPTPTL